MTQRLRILMVAPEPIFEPRGTPFSIIGRLKALSDMGHRVDLVTYPLGKDVAFPGLRLFRTIRIPGIRRVKIGPSFTKIPLDILLMGLTFRRLILSRYDLLHTHEEAGCWGTFFSFLFGVPHVYDMHSSLPQQLRNFRFSRSRLLTWCFEALERWVLRHADAVITICADLQERVDRIVGKGKAVLIENVLDYTDLFGKTDSKLPQEIIQKIDGRRIALYTGTLEPYQGIDLLVESAALLKTHHPELLFLVVGGHPDQVATYRSLVSERGLDTLFYFTGQIFPMDVPSYIAVADLLVSPRITGTNTPLKIYGYLRSGVPIVATRIWSHTQVLNETVAELTDPTPEAFAAGIRHLLEKPNHARRLATQAKWLAQEAYGVADYYKRLERVLHLAMESA